MYENIYKELDFLEQVVQKFVCSGATKEQTSRIYGLFLALSWMELEGIYKSHLCKIALDGLCNENPLHKSLRRILCDDRDNNRPVITLDLRSEVNMPPIKDITNAYKKLVGTPPSEALLKNFRDWVAHGQYYSFEENLDANQLYELLNQFKKQLNDKLSKIEPAEQST